MCGFTVLCTDSRLGCFPQMSKEMLGYRLMVKVQIVLDEFGGKSETTRWLATAKVNRQLAYQSSWVALFLEVKT